jgi:hypothetical protein
MGDRQSLPLAGQIASAAIRLFAQMPGDGPSELPIAGDRAGLGHSGHAEIGGVGECGGEHDAPIVGRCARMTMCRGSRRCWRPTLPMT